MRRDFHKDWTFAWGRWRLGVLARLTVTRFLVGLEYTPPPPLAVATLGVDGYGSYQKARIVYLCLGPFTLGLRLARTHLAEPPPEVRQRMAAVQARMAAERAMMEQIMEELGIPEEPREEDFGDRV